MDLLGTKVKFGILDPKFFRFQTTNSISLRAHTHTHTMERSKWSDRHILKRKAAEDRYNGQIPDSKWNIHSFHSARETKSKEQVRSTLEVETRDGSEIFVSPGGTICHVSDNDKFSSESACFKFSASRVDRHEEDCVPLYKVVSTSPAHPLMAEFYTSEHTVNPDWYPFEAKGQDLNIKPRDVLGFPSISQMSPSPWPDRETIQGLNQACFSNSVGRLPRWIAASRGFQIHLLRENRIERRMCRFDDEKWTLSCVPLSIQCPGKDALDKRRSMTSLEEMRKRTQIVFTPDENYMAACCESDIVGGSGVSVWNLQNLPKSKSARASADTQCMDRALAPRCQIKGFFLSCAWLHNKDRRLLATLSGFCQVTVWDTLPSITGRPVKVATINLGLHPDDLATVFSISCSGPGIPASTGNERIRVIASTKSSGCWFFTLELVKGKRPSDRWTLAVKHREFYSQSLNHRTRVCYQVKSVASFTSKEQGYDALCVVRENGDQDVVVVGHHN